MFKSNLNKLLSSSEKTLYILSSLVIIFSIFISIILKKFNLEISFSPYPCLSNKFLHIYCPGCGGTRALRLLLEFSFLKSFMYNPIVLYIFILFIYYYVGTTIYIISKGNYKIFTFSTSMIYTAIIILLLNFILRNILAIFFNIDYIGDIHSFWN